MNHPSEIFVESPYISVFSLSILLLKGFRNSAKSSSRRIPLPNSNSDSANLLHHLCSSRNVASIRAGSSFSHAVLIRRLARSWLKNLQTILVISRFRLVIDRCAFSTTRSKPWWPAPSAFSPLSTKLWTFGTEWATLCVVSSVFERITRWW